MSSIVNKYACQTPWWQTELRYLLSLQNTSLLMRRYLHESSYFIILRNVFLQEQWLLFYFTLLSNLFSTSFELEAIFDNLWWKMLWCNMHLNTLIQHLNWFHSFLRQNGYRILQPSNKTLFLSYFKIIKCTISRYVILSKVSDYKHVSHKWWYFLCNNNKKVLVVPSWENSWQKNALHFSV